MQTANEMIADGRSVLTRKVQPVQNSLKLTLFNATDCTQTVALNQHGHCIQKWLSLCSQGFKESAFVETEGMLTGGTVKPALKVAMDFEVSALGLSKVSASCVLAPLFGSVHRASPLSTRRCVNDILIHPFTA